MIIRTTTLRYFFASAIFALVMVKPLLGKTLIWDIGFTLIEPNHFSIARKVGFVDCVCMYLTHGSLAYGVVDESIFDILMDGNEAYMACVPYDPEGRLMPNCMCEWIKSTKTNNEILQQALINAERYPDYVNARHKRLVKNILRWMFDPKEFATSMKPMFGAAGLLRECARAKDKCTNQPHNFYILSNWDEESFDYLFTSPANKRIFRYFKRENIYISGYFKDMKPHLPIFEHMLEKYNLAPADCIFIDDQVDNVRAARAHGITSIQIKNGNYRDVRKKLKKLGVI